MCVGLMMMLNLLAAHLWRFKVQASGTRLLAGLGMTSLGVLITFLVIASGHNSQGLQGVPFFSWGQMWIGLLFLYMAASSAAGPPGQLGARPFGIGKWYSAAADYLWPLCGSLGDSGGSVVLSDLLAAFAFPMKGCASSGN